VVEENIMEKDIKQKIEPGFLRSVLFILLQHQSSRDENYNLDYYNEIIAIK